MYAILQQGGHQYRVSPGDRLVVDRLSAAVGDVVELEPVLLVGSDERPELGTPAVAGARVTATVVAHRASKKIRVFKYKAKKRYRRTFGHRSQLTELRVETVLGDAREAEPGDAASSSAAAENAEKKRTAAAAPRRRRAREVTAPAAGAEE